MVINDHQLVSSVLRIPARRRSDLEGGLKHKFFRNKIDSTSQIDFGQRKRILRLIPSVPEEMVLTVQISTLCDH